MSGEATTTRLACTMVKISPITVLLLSQTSIATAFCHGQQPSPATSFESNYSVDNRRDAITEIIHQASLLTVATTTLAPAKTNAQYTKPLPLLSSAKQLSEYIQRNCNQSYLRSVRLSGYNFLYRGYPEETIKVVHSNKKIQACIIDEPSDLLDPKTYQSTAAASYFQKLEVKLSAINSEIKPSNGHLATTCPKEASTWGTPVSVWPLGEEGVNFAWLKDGGVFWPVLGKESSNHEREIVVGMSSGLDKALKGDAWEIMFRADNGFLIVPAKFDDELRDCLKKFLSGFDWMKDSYGVK